jgi:1,4-dihydroxy-2-naphthoyl-CoA hydrolase
MDNEKKIWQRHFDLDILNATSKNTLVDHLNIVYTEFTNNSLTATMPVNSNTHQPLGLLHGGASVVLAETLGSIAANFCVPEGHFCLGMEINANHLKSVRSGVVTGVAKPIHIGRNTQLWEIKIVDQAQNLVCISRLTMMVKQKNSTSNRE